LPSFQKVRVLLPHLLLRVDESLVKEQLTEPFPGINETGTMRPVFALDLGDSATTRS
jgi:hypothetical protein